MSVYDSGVEEYDNDSDEEEEYDSEAQDSDNNEEKDDEEESVDFEDQGSSDDEDDILEDQIKKAEVKHNENDSGDELELVEDFEAVPRVFAKTKNLKRNKDGKVVPTYEEKVDIKVAKLVHTDDFSSDDEDFNGKGNRI